MSAPLIVNGYTKRIPTQKTSTLTLCILFLLGLILGHFFAQLGDDAPSNNESNFASLSTSELDRLHGWDSVDVFYGSTATFERTLPQDLEWFSQAGQDEVVMSLLRYKEGGYFIDLAANDATLLSNTYVLETKYHWKGLCIEPNPEYWENLAFREPIAKLSGPLWEMRECKRCTFDWMPEIMVALPDKALTMVPDSRVSRKYAIQ